MSLDSSFTRTHVLAKKGPVDGDGDGWVYDGTPKKRPATPAEQAAGARLRAGKKAAGPVAGKKAAAPRKAAAKKAPAKNDYDKRVDKFDRAINQAIRSGDKKQIKQVHDLIGQDFVLKKPDRDDLQNVLAARRDGLADPPPVKGSNRAVRMPKQAGEAPAPAKAPAKKAAAPRAAAKKVAEKKPEAPPAKKTTPPPAKKVDAAKRIEAHTGKPGLPPRAGQGDLQRRIAQSNAKKKMEEAAGKTIDSEKGVQELADAIIAAREAGVPDSELAPFRERLRAAADHVDRKAIKDRMSLERRAAKKVAAKKPSAPKPVETTHGLKTRAWMRHAEKDIKAARDFRTLKGRVTQINNALAAKRITEREANHLRKMVIDRLGELGLDRNGQRKDPTWKPGNPSWADRLKAKIKSPKKGPGTATRAKEQASFERKAMENAVFRVKQRIDDAKDMDSLAQLRGQLRADPVNKPLRDHLRANPSKLEAINDHFRQKRDQLAQAAAAEPKAKPETVVPKLPPGEARERAKANLPSEWADRLNAARNLSDLEGLMDRLEGDKSIPNDDFNKVAEALNEAMDREEDRANAFAAAGVEFDEPMDRDIRARLDTYFAKPKSNIANAPQEGLYQYMLVTPERFEFKQQNDNMGVSGIDIITDKVTGERWFAKHSEFRNDYGKEMVAGDVLNQAGISKHAVRVSKNGAYGRSSKEGEKLYPGMVMLTQDALQGNGLDGELKRAADMRHDDIAKEEVEKGLQQGDPQGLIDMAVFDYLIDNKVDRHAANAFFQRKGNAMKVQFIDHGLAFGGFGGNPKPQERFYDWFVMGYRANRKGGWDISRLIGESVATREELADRVDAAVAKFDNLDLAAIRQRYEDAANGDPDMMAAIDKIIETLEQRKERLQNEKDDIVRVLVNAGGVL